MAKTFKSLLGDDVANTRTLLHEAIPITGTISSGTYREGAYPHTETNIKTFSHGMFESVYDYPYLSSSANHIYDLTFGYSSNVSSSAHTQNSKKLNIYNQMAQVLMGYDASGSIRKFDSDGTLDDSTGVMNHCFFMNFSRLLTKDEIKKNSFRLSLWTSGTMDHKGLSPVTGKDTIGDYASANQFRTSPAGDYGLLFTGSGCTDGACVSGSVGLIFYQAGVVVLTSSVFAGDFGVPNVVDGGAASLTGAITPATQNRTIEQVANHLRHRIRDVDFNNTIELNSAIYFCRINHNEFNYSSNPTYVSGSKVVIKNNVNDLPITYATAVGLYSPDNELLAVAKLSEPLRKDPNTELTLRVRLDY
mgnify:FL=1|tara:strand:- start:136 stop:1218 length:1083 start_codon:yes stop_codon:yes gene_type:complete